MFDEALSREDFVELNEKNFMNKKGKLLFYEELDTTVQKLRTQFKTLKSEWRKITDRWRNGSGLAPEGKPTWYDILNNVFAETNEEINLSSCAAETSFADEEVQEYEDDNDKSDKRFENNLTNDDNAG